MLTTGRAGAPGERCQPDPATVVGNGLALAHHRLGHPADARRWLTIAERWLQRLDGIYTAEAPGVLTGQPQAPVPFEFWVYAQVLRREAAGRILDRDFPTDPFAR